MDNGKILGYPLVNIQKTDGKDPPFYCWENPLFRLGHFLAMLVYQRVKGKSVGNH